MKVKVQEEFNVFELFVHDNEALYAVDAYNVAEAINEHLIDLGWKVYPPDGLDRFVLVNANDENERYSERYYSTEQVMVELPQDAIEQLEAINELDLDLSLRAAPGG
jgi:hypothetical protein